MKATITIEQYDNGITLKWEDAEGNEDPHNIVAPDRDITRAIGETIWDDIKNLMDRYSANVVKMAIDYLTEEQQ